MSDSVRSAVLASTSLTPVIQLSDEQTAIAQEVFKGRTNLMVRARAGTGKTFLLRQVIKLMGGTVQVCAYNTKIAGEIRNKLQADGHLRSMADRIVDANRRPAPDGNFIQTKSGADVDTFHAKGWGIIRKMLPKVRLEGYDDDQAGFYKFPKIAERLEIPETLRSCVRKAMERAQERCFGVLFPLNDADQWLALADHYDLRSELPEDGAMLAQMMGAVGETWQEGLVKVCLRYAAKAIKISLDMVREKFTRERTVGRGKNARTVKGEDFVGVISFTEMMYLPLIWNMPFPKYDWVLVDEAQDSNPARREMARRLLKAGGRMLWVGDDRQAIYGFSGADSDALDIIIREFRCKVMPMTVTFRCAKAVVRKAQQLVPDYKAANDNPEGEEITISEDDFYNTALLASREHGTGDAIICRNTKPLISIAYKLIGAGVACHVEGREIGRGLIDLIERWPTIKTFPALTDKLTEYKDREVANLIAKQKEMQAEALTDKIETVLAIMAGMPKGSKVDDLRAKVNSLFADTNGKPSDTVTLLTAHRSKGLEYTRVFLWGEQKYMPSKWAKQDWQMVQEENLIYVAYTRAIHSLVSVEVVSDDAPLAKAA